jgi:hypothetical protein
MTGSSVKRASLGNGECVDSEDVDGCADRLQTGINCRQDQIKGWRPADRVLCSVGVCQSERGPANEVCCS